MAESIRLQKWIAELGLASRREAERWIAAGRISVNGKIVQEMGTKIDPETDKISLDGKLYRKKVPPRVYWLFNKPDKLLTARPTETEPKKTIYDVPSLKKLTFMISPVGRLDFRTEGLLLLTNDGELANRLCRPEYKVPRRYAVCVKGKLKATDLQTIKKGVELEDGVVKNVRIQLAEGRAAGKGSWYFVTVEEGRNRLVRRIFEHFELEVTRLIRIGFGDISLDDDLPAGEYRQLTNAEIKYLKSSVDLQYKPEPRKKSPAKKTEAL